MRKFKFELKTRVCEDTDSMLRKWVSDLSVCMGRKVSISAGIRWLLESYFGVETFSDDTLSDKTFPKTATDSVHHDKNLRAALEKMDDITAKLSSELVSEKNRADMNESLVKDAARELLEAMGSSVIHSLPTCTNMVISHLYQKEMRIRNGDAEILHLNGRIASVEKRLKEYEAECYHYKEQRDKYEEQLKDYARQSDEYKQQRDRFERIMKHELGLNKKCFERIKLLKGEFEDWMSVLSTERNRSFFKKFFKLFGLKDRITDDDREWANREVVNIDLSITNLLDK